MGVIPHLHTIHERSGCRKDFEGVGALEFAQERSQTAGRLFNVFNGALIDGDDEYILFVEAAILDELGEPHGEDGNVFIFSDRLITWSEQNAVEKNGFHLPIGPIFFLDPAREDLPQPLP